MSEAPLNPEQEFQQYASLVKLVEGGVMTGAEIGAAITALRNSFDIIKNSVNALDAAKQADLIRAISSMNLELSKLETELAAKNRTILDLEEKIAQKEEIRTEKRGRVWYSVADNEPCCKNCTGKHSRLVYLDDWFYNGDFVGYECPECERKIAV